MRYIPFRATVSKRCFQVSTANMICSHDSAVPSESRVEVVQADTQDDTPTLIASPSLLPFE